MSEGFHIYHDLFINVTPDKVYAAITLPQHINNWWTLHCSGIPVSGEAYNFYFSDAYNWFGKVVIADADSSFGVKMTHADADWNPTSFGFTLLSEGLGTQVAFQHTGWLQNNHHFRRSSFCWAILLNNLKKYLEADIIVPFTDRE